MSPNELVKPDELSQPVACIDVEAWVESLFKRFQISKEAKQHLILGNGVVREMIDELAPLSKFVSSFYEDSDAFLRFYPGSENSFDADIIDEKGSIIERIEVTMAIDGQQKRLQAEALLKHGHSLIYETPEYSGNSKNRIISEPEFNTIDDSEIIEIQSSLLQTAYDKKQGMLSRYPNTTLLIGVHMPVSRPEEFDDVVHSLSIEANTFNSIKCVNVAGNHCAVLK